MEPQKLTPDQQKLVNDNLDLARYLALDAWRKNRQDMEKEEVVAVAYQGLVTAALRFDPTVVTAETLANGKAFSGYARQRIVGSIVDWQRSRDHVPRRSRRTYKNFQQQGWGQGRSADEISDLTGMEVEKVRAIITSVEQAAVSLDIPADYFGSLDYNREVSSENVEASVLESRVLDAVGATINGLSHTHQVILAMRYYRGFELADISQHLDIRLSLVRELHSEAMLAIHDATLKEAS